MQTLATFYSADRCSPGEFSSTGVVPCSSCSFGTYQSDYESTTCLSCDQNTFTSSTGSTNKLACKGIQYIIELLFLTSIRSCYKEKQIISLLCQLQTPIQII